MEMISRLLVIVSVIQQVTPDVPDVSLYQQRLFLHFEKCKFRNRFFPITSNKSLVIIYISIDVLEVRDADELVQWCQLYGKVHLSYKNEFFSWNPHNFGGLSKIETTKRFFWIPPLLIYNSKYDYKMHIYRSATILSTGEIQMKNYFTEIVFCKFYMTYFPFDQQTCRIVIALWDFDNTQVVFKVLNRRNPKTNTDFASEWIIVASKEEVRNATFTGDSSQYSVYFYTFYMKRRPDIYVICVILPCVLLSLITTMGYILPTDSGERVSFGLTIIFAFSIFHMKVTKKVPTTANSYPLVTYLINISVIYTTVFILFSSVVVHLFHLGSIPLTSPPKYLLTLCNKHLRWFVLLAELPCEIEDEDQKADEHGTEGVSVKRTQTDNQFWQKRRTVLDTKNVNVTENDTHSLIKNLVDKFKAHERRSRRSNEWKFVAKVVSRVLFLFSFLTLIVLGILYYLYAYYFVQKSSITDDIGMQKEWTI